MDTPSDGSDNDDCRDVVGVALSFGYDDEEGEDGPVGERCEDC